MFGSKFASEIHLHRRAVAFYGVRRNALAFGAAAGPGMFSHIGDETSDHIIPKLISGLVIGLFWYTCIGYRFCFHGFDLNLFAIALKEIIEVFQRLPLLVGGRSQQTITCMAYSTWSSILGGAGEGGGNETLEFAVFFN